MSPVRAVVFDLDRTLVDVQSCTDYGTALADVRRLVAAWTEVGTPRTCTVTEIAVVPGRCDDLRVPSPR